MNKAIQAANVIGQSVWFDNLRREMLSSGELATMVRDGLGGITSNPSTFEKAIMGSAAYDHDLRRLVRTGVPDSQTVYERLAAADIRAAADVLRPRFDASLRHDGYVSWEVSPVLAHDTQAAISEATRLFRLVERDNVMIKVPGTPAGVGAIAPLIAAGVNVNITLLFSLDAYRTTADAYLTGLEQRVRSGADPTRVASVASFFLSRIDTAVDQRVSAELDITTDALRRARLQSLLGQVAVANAKLAYAHLQDLMRSRRWQALAKIGAHVQRVLWASTGVKNPAYPPLKYVEDLIGPETINTMPAETYQAFRDHGRVRASVTEGVPAARDTMRALTDVGLSMQAITGELLQQGVDQFAQSFSRLLANLDAKRRDLASTK